MQSKKLSPTKQNILNEALLDGYQKQYYTENVKCSGRKCTNIIYYFEPDGANFRFGDYNDTVHGLCVIDENDIVINSSDSNIPIVERCIIEKRNSSSGSVIAFCSTVCADNYKYKYKYDGNEGYACEKCAKSIPKCHVCKSLTRKYSDSCDSCGNDTCSKCIIECDGEYDTCINCCKCSVCDVYNDKIKTHTCKFCYDTICTNCSITKNNNFFCEKCITCKNCNILCYSTLYRCIQCCKIFCCEKCKGKENICDTCRSSED